MIESILQYILFDQDFSTTHQPYLAMTAGIELKVMTAKGTQKDAVDRSSKLTCLM